MALAAFIVACELAKDVFTSDKSCKNNYDDWLKDEERLYKKQINDLRVIEALKNKLLREAKMKEQEKQTDSSTWKPILTNMNAGKDAPVYDGWNEYPQCCPVPWKCIEIVRVVPRGDRSGLRKLAYFTGSAFVRAKDDGSNDCLPIQSSITHWRYVPELPTWGDPDLDQKYYSIRKELLAWNSRCMGKFGKEFEAWLVTKDEEDIISEYFRQHGFTRMHHIYEPSLMSGTTWMGKRLFVTEPSTVHFVRRELI